MVIALIQPTRLRAVQDALTKIGVERMTVCDAQGFGRQHGQTAMYRGVQYSATLLQKVELEIVVNEDFLERTIETISNVARTGAEGNIGDGKIFVLPAIETYRISDRTTGPEAV